MGNAFFAHVALLWHCKGTAMVGRSGSPSESECDLGLAMRCYDAVALSLLPKIAEPTLTLVAPKAIAVS
jgi:hypothetical protein